MEPPADPDEVSAPTAGVLRVVDGLRRLPADLAAIVIAVVATNVVVLAPVIRDTPLRVPLGLAFVLFVPGYAFIAALFPETGGPADAVETADAGEPAADGGGAATSSGPLPSSGIDGIERVALSFGLSIAITPLIGLVLNFTPWGIRLVPILVSLSAFTLVSTAVGARRRRDLPPEDRFHVPYAEWTAAARSELFEPSSRADLALNVLLVLSVVVAASSVGYAVLVPQQGESFTELYLLTESEDGDLVADDYPTEYTLGEGRELTVGVGNHEHQSMDYTVLVRLQDVRTANNSTSVLRSERLAQFDLSISHNETWHRQHTVSPTFAGTRLRLQYLLYRGDAPSNPAVTTAYRDAHLWINVSR